MNIQYEVTLDDLVAYNRYHCAHSPTIRWTKIKCVAIVSALFVGGSFLIPSNGVLPREFILLGSFVLAGVYAAIFLWWFPISIDRHARSLFGEGSNKGVVGLHELKIDEDGLTERTDYNETRCSWKGVERIVETDQYAMIYISSNVAHVIPKQSVTHGDWEAFIARTRELWETRSAPEASR